MENMTVITRQMYDRAARASTVRQAAQVLRRAGDFRDLGTILRSFSDDGNLRQTLVEGLLEWSPGANRDSLDRKVRNWLGGRTRSVDKEDAYILSRVLQLPLDRTDAFLKQVTGEGIHWRDPAEIVWTYGIVRCLSPGEIRQLQEDASALGKTAKPSLKPDVYTAEIHEKLEGVLGGSREELLAFLEQEWDRLGTFHNTAYQLFIQYMDLLEKGFSDSDVETLFDAMTDKERRQRHPDVEGDTELYRPDELTTREILETYLYRRLVPVAERGAKRDADAFSAVQRSIRGSWPDEFTLSRMKKRQLDVSRKTLILLFLATNGGAGDYGEGEDEEFEDEDLELTPDQVFQDLYLRLDLMLSDCGFQQLDPRSPFDWIVLFCISSGDLWESDSRLQEMLAELFPREE